MATIADLQEVISIKFTEEILEGILRKESGFDGVKVVKIRLGAESKKGDSYLSTVTRFSVDYAVNNELGVDVHETIHIIAKGLPKNIGRRKTFRSTDFFKNEVSFYNEVWPKLDAFQKSKNPKTLFKDIPNCLYAYADGLYDYIVLEDLSYEGFGNAERSTVLDTQHAKLILKVFAQFHALAYAVKRENPEEFTRIADSLQETYFSENHRKWYEKFQEILKDIARDAVEKELPENYLLRLNKVFEEDFFGSISKICAARGPLAVITHGDAWIPNFLLKYDEDKLTPLKAIMIDFQLTRCSSLTMDLLFFLYTCADQKLRDESFDELIAFYHQEFKEFLANLGCSDMFTLQELKDDMKTTGVFSIGMSMEGVIMSLFEDDEVADLDQIQGEDEIAIETIWIVKPLKTEAKRKRLADCFKHSIDSGIF